MDQYKTKETLKLFYSCGGKILPRHIDDNLRYVGGLTRVLAADAFISFAGLFHLLQFELMVKLMEFCGNSVDLRCQLPNEGVPNADTGGDYEKNEDEDDFFFACTNPNGSPISIDDIFQTAQIRSVFPIFNRDLLFADADDNDSSRAKRVAASSSSLQPLLKKLFFEE